MARMHHGLSRYDQLMKSALAGEGPAASLPNTFGRLFPANEVQIEHLTHEGLIKILEDIALEMGKETDVSGPAAAGMTFFGQFVDHDITLDATSALGTRIVPSTIRNVRTPALDLDCVYGAGPEGTPHLYGANETDKGGPDTTNFLVYGNAANAHDLARTRNGAALIGDPRNDENAIVGQIQANFIALHNILMTEKLGGAGHDEIRDCARMGTSVDDWTNHVPSHHMAFEEVRRFMRLHYQYVVWNELLPAFVDQSCLDEARLNDLFGADAAIMPVEFSGAAYRFGHATTQPDYALKKNAGQTSMFDILGFGQRSGVVDMQMFFDIDGTRTQSARPVGPTLGKPLTALPFIRDKVMLEDIHHELTLPQSQNLPLRNMLRDRYTYKLANGEWIADNWFKKKLKRSLPKVEMHKDLTKAGITKTPLWFYILQEAHQFGDGKLTGVGGAIVASVFARLLRLDGTTYWHASGFTPSPRFDNAGGVMAGMMKYAEANRDKIAHADALKNG